MYFELKNLRILNLQIYSMILILDFLIIKKKMNFYLYILCVFNNLIFKFYIFIIIIVDNLIKFYYYYMNILKLIIL